MSLQSFVPDRGDVIWIGMDQPAVGLVLADQVGNLAWQARKGTPLGQVPPSIVREVVSKLSTLLSG